VNAQRRRFFAPAIDPVQAESLWIEHAAEPPVAFLVLLVDAVAEDAQEQLVVRGGPPHVVRWIQVFSPARQIGKSSKSLASAGATPCRFCDYRRFAKSPG